VNRRTEKRADSVIEGFRHAFGSPPEVVSSAPGRVNIIGEHTDYSHGFALPAAIPLYTTLAIGRSNAPETAVVSTRFGRVSFAPVPLAKHGGFEDYVAGAIKQAGFEGTALNIFIDSSLPAEAGLSSSASLLVALMAALFELSGQKWSPMDTALAAREVENSFVGVPCGFMDQFAVACGKEDTALLLDCMDNSHIEVPTALFGYRWVVVYSGIRRELAKGGYARLVATLKSAVERVIAEAGISAGFTRCFSQEAVDELGPDAGLTGPETALLKHVVAENSRVHTMRFALERQCAQAVGMLLVQSHRSLSRLFKVSTAGLDALVDHASSLGPVAGMRLTGAGMGGSLVALTAEENLDGTCADIERFVQTTLSKEGKVYVIPRFCGGVATWRP